MAMAQRSTSTVTEYYTDSLAVSVGGIYNYTADDKVTYNICKYMDGDVEKLDVEVPTYTIAESVMGDLTIGTYTVKGLTYDNTKGGYYKDYAADGLSMYFKAETNGKATMDNTYALSKGNQNILVVFNGSNVVVTNNFAPGVMPFPITTTFPKASSTGIANLNSDAKAGVVYNLAGQRVASDAKGIVIINGKKYLNK